MSQYDQYTKDLNRKSSLQDTDIFPVLAPGSTKTQIQDLQSLKLYINADPAGAADAAIAAHEAAADPHSQYVQKVTGKGLSTNDYTTVEKNKLAGLNEWYLGTYTSLAQLQAAHPTAQPGNYALVDGGSGQHVKQYNWDAEDGWVIGSGDPVTSTDVVPEGSTNKYFTDARAQDAVIDDTQAAGNTTFSSDKVEQILPSTRLLPQTTSILSYLQDRYQAFPSIAMDRESYKMAQAIWKDAPNHVSEGNIKWAISYDGFVTHSDPVTVTYDGTPVTNAATCMIGFGRNGRSVIAFNRGTSGTADLTILYFAKCNNGDHNFTSTTTMSLPAGISFLFPFGKTIVMPGSGELRMLGYCQETGSSYTSTCFFRSLDNGDSWTYGGIIARGGNVTIYPPEQTFPISPSEADWDIISTDGTDAGTKLVMIVRDDFNYRHLQYHSDDGGTTWLNALQTPARTFAFGDTIGGSNTAFWPCTVLCVNDMLYALHCIRMPPNTTAAYSMRLFAKPALSVYNNPNNWNYNTDFTTLYRPWTFYKYDYIDWGYGWMVMTPAYRLRTIFYDGDPKGAVNVAVPKTITVKTTDLVGANDYSAYNAANQTVAPGSEVKVLLPNESIRTNQNFIDADGNIVAPTDGWYDVTARVKWQPSTDGTYRLLEIMGVDHVMEGGAYGLNLIGKNAIAPSSVSELNYQEVRGKMFLYANMEIRVTVEHDASGSLTLDNSSYYDRATVLINQIA